MVRACEFCRKRKIKCDSAKPTCSTCRSNNKVCLYHSGPRKQRPSAARIDHLEREKSALEHVLTRLKDADEAQRRALLDSVVIVNGRVSHGSTIHPERERHEDLQLLRGLEADIGSPIIQEENFTLPGEALDRATSHIPGHRNNDQSSISHNEDKETCATDEPRSPHASDSIFSSTSVIHSSRLSRAFGHEDPQFNTDALRYQLFANAAMERQREHRLRGLSNIRGVPAALALHLLDLHWSRQHHTFLLTYRPTFMRELECGGAYCSDLLLYTVFACASKFSERPGPEAGQQFFARCDELLLREGLIIQSSIPTVIALVMLGSTFIARGMTSKGWLYTGYAMRMVFDLGLYIEPHPDHNKFNAEEIEIRRRVFWGAFVCEKLQSLYLGRPPTIRLQDVHVSRDFLDTYEELEAWQPYDDCDSPGARIISSTLPLAHSVTVFQELCSLSQIMTQIIDKIYCVDTTASTALQKIRHLDDTLTKWYSNLPAHLIYEPWTRDPLDSPPMVAPNRIILLTTYYSLLVLLHRPFIVVSSSPSETATIGTPAFSWRRCTTASRHITSLVLSYQSIYPLRKSSYLLGYAVYVACTVHVLNTASLLSATDRNAYTEASMLLAASLRCLDALGVPNSGAADTARIIRKLMAAKGVEELSTVVEPQDVTFHQPCEDSLQFPNIPPTSHDLEQMAIFQDIFDPGQDLLFGFMNENVNLGAFNMDESNS
ncbi:hypothetical protein N7478_012607 [Penicillium angulare]|uniref:uncharacterized protein n=1 Tax=Penicillium angulare TaxID=116970 RepID=UPI0025410DAF|nr:uncharacterized protein N7478_012607 [Penicillium angulare]KAJ5259626.1 hypothetical protein N7478_012607 [Penicillium angulare]